MRGIIVGVAIGWLSSFGAWAQELSADIRETVSGDPVAREPAKVGKFHLSGQRVRVVMPEGGTYILTPDHAWWIDPDAKTYHELYAGPLNFLFAKPGGIDGICRSLGSSSKSCAIAGKAVVQSRTAISFLIVENNGERTKGWVDLKSGVTLKLITTNTHNKRIERIELVNIHESQQPDSLFSVPDDYQYAAKSWELPALPEAKPEPKP